ncbi:MAG: hypothetical protein OER21_10550 [Gemmatimonadota bacterium]|nr:hypothetical protein [Gemmatimonadota bacterium]
MHAAALSQLLPPVVGVAAGRLSPPPRRWAIIWCLLLVSQDGLALALASQGLNNLWVSYVFMPAAGAAVLWTLSLWHPGDTARLTLRIAIPIFVAVSVALTLATENPEAFSLFTATFQNLVLLLAALWTFLRRSLGETRPLTSQDWFWTVLGIMLYAGTSSALEPLAGYLLASQREDLLHAAINVRAAVDIVAFLAIAGGMLCPLPTSSGGSSSPRSSPSPYSSAPSALRW